MFGAFLQKCRTQYCTGNVQRALKLVSSASATRRAHDKALCANGHQHMYSPFIPNKHFTPSLWNARSQNLSNNLSLFTIKCSIGVVVFGEMPQLLQSYQMLNHELRLCIRCENISKRDDIRIFAIQYRYHCLNGALWQLWEKGINIHLNVKRAEHNDETRFSLDTKHVIRYKRTWS